MSDCYRHITVFDFDGTIFKGDSFHRFALHAVGVRRYAVSLIRCLPYLVAWKCGMSSSSCVKQRLFGYLYKGMPRMEFESYGRRFITKISACLNQDVVADLCRRLKSGDTVYVVSASLKEWIEPWAMTVGRIRVIATEASIDFTDRLDGRFRGANCRGVEKLRRLRLAEPNMEQCYLTVVTDNVSDVPLMEVADDVVFLKAGRPVQSRG